MGMMRYINPINNTINDWPHTMVGLLDVDLLGKIFLDCLYCGHIRQAIEDFFQDEFYDCSVGT